MTSILFEAIYDEATLRKMNTSDLRDIWKRISSPPSLKEHIIQDILKYQKKNKHEKLFSARDAEVNRHHWNRRKTRHTNSSDVKDQKDLRSRHRRGMSAPSSELDAPASLQNYRRVSTGDMEENKPYSSIGDLFKRMLAPSDEIKTADTEDHSVVKDRLKSRKVSRVDMRRAELADKRRKASRSSRRLEAGLSSTGFNDINLSGLDIIKKKEHEAALVITQEKSDVFHIRPPTNRSKDGIKLIS